MMDHQGTYLEHVLTWEQPSDKTVRLASTVEPRFNRQLGPRARPVDEIGGFPVVTGRLPDRRNREVGLKAVISRRDTEEHGGRGLDTVFRIQGYQTADLMWEGTEG
jgi:hypothetical protein